jgi:hypothetical protein
VTTRLPYRTTDRRSELLFHFRAADLEFVDPRNPSTGALKPVNVLTKQTATFVRASTATAISAQGTTYNVGHSLPAWSWYNGRPALLIRPADSPRTVESLEITFNYATLASHSGYIAMFDLSAVDAPILHWGAAATNDATTFALVGVDSTTVELLELRWTVAADGAITIGAAVNGGTEQIGSASAAAAGVSTAPDTKLWIGSRGTTETSGDGIAQVKIAAGAHTMAEMREMF